MVGREGVRKAPVGLEALACQLTTEHPIHPKAVGPGSFFRTPITPGRGVQSPLRRQPCGLEHDWYSLGME